MRHFFSTILIAAVAVTLVGCAAPTPVIDKTRFVRPASVTIVEPPPMRNQAFVGIRLVPNWFAHPRHFSPQFDSYFVTDAPIAASNDSAVQPRTASVEVAQAAVQSSPATQSVAHAAIGGAVAGALHAAEEASAERAMQYDQELRLRVPDFDLRKDIVRSLSAALEQRGVAVSVIAGDNTAGPRLRWPAKGLEGFAEVGSIDAPAVDTDLVLQVSPIAYWFAPGLMNNFRRTGNIGVVIYNGRTKEYLGSQSFWYDSPAWQHEYARYSTLVADSAGATSAMREGLLTLVPQIVDAVLGSQTTR